MNSRIRVVGKVVSVLGGAVFIAALVLPPVAHAQNSNVTLEEVVVTAQRRVQSLQEVPISVSVFNGAELQQQGFRNLSSLSNFSASVTVNDEGFLSQERTVRGFGTSGNALTLEQAVPIFIDGIHFGRAAQIETGFLDEDRVEVLKGPQPVYFGMSATAGAFNIHSKGPTPTWEGYLDGEYGNNSKEVIEGAIGGPLTKTLGIRVAGKYDSSGGFMRDVLTRQKIYDYNLLGGRVILEWKPMDNLTVRTKYEASKQRKGPEAVHICLTEGSLIYGRNDPTRASDEGNSRAVWAPPPKGEGTVIPHIPLDYNCFGSNKAVSAGGDGVYFSPPVNIHEENSDTGAIDARAAVDAWNKMLWDQRNHAAGSPDGIKGEDAIDANNGYLDITYRFNNGIEVDSLTGYSGYNRINVRDNSYSPFLMNLQDRVEIYDQWSSELRFTSPTGGRIEWMAGLFWQNSDYDITSNSPRPNVRRGLRYNDVIWEDQDWKSAFANITLNFLDNRASIDLGGRYTSLKKRGYIHGVSAQWVFDVKPCAATPDGSGGYLDDDGGGNFDPATCPTAPDAMHITAAQTEFLLPGADASNLWALPYHDTRVTPSSWRGGRASAVGMTRLSEEGRNPAFTPQRGGTFDFKKFDPQVTLRYRIGNHSLFARWARASEPGGFDTGVTSINKTIDDFRFEPEYAQSWEVGSKGTFWNRRARYDVTLFWTEFNDFQITVPTGNPDDPFLNVNAGKQRVRGAEFNVTAALTDQLQANLSGALMDGKMVTFPAGGCTEQEAQDYMNSGCILNKPGDPSGGGHIDRSGEQSPKTPKWKFVLAMKYWHPVWDNYKVTVNGQGYISAAYLTDINGFSKTVMMNQHGDMDLILGFGSMDDSWRVSAWARNIFEARPSYNKKYDVIPDGLLTSSMSPNMFRTYGVKFRYNFR